MTYESETNNDNFCMDYFKSHILSDNALKILIIISDRQPFSIALLILFNNLYLIRDLK